MKYFKFAVAFSVLCLFAVQPSNSCVEGPSVFHFTARPDGPLSNYASGNIGLLHPTFARSHLVVAWRYLSGIPLTPVEQQGYLGVMQQRLNDEDLRSRAVEQWLEARKSVTADAVTIDVYSYRGNYASYVNCPNDAFATATATLDARIAKFGADSAAVRSWLEAQDAVFANCEGGGGMPATVDESLPLLIRQDRAYQRAAAAFYAANWDESRALFAEVAKDASSPWSAIAPYVRVRALVREATLAGDEGYFDKDLLDQAWTEVETLLADPRQASIRGQLRSLRAFIQYRRDPESRFAEAASELKSAAAEAVFRGNLADYTLLFDSEPSADDMSEWIETFKAGRVFDPFGDAADTSPADESYAKALDRWRSQKSLPWLVAALTHAGPSSESLSDLLSAAATVPSTSPAYVTLRYQRVRLLRALGREDEWAADCDAVLALDSAKLPESARNTFKAFRMTRAASIGEFMKDARRNSVGSSTEMWRDDVPLVSFENDAAAVLNQRVPLDQLVLALEDTTLPSDLRANLLIAAFTRAVVLGRHDVVKKLGDEVTTYLSGRGVADDLRAYIDSDPRHAETARALFLSRMTMLTPWVQSMDPEGGSWWNYWRDAWWCSATPLTAPVPPFAQQPAVRAAAEREQKVLAATGSGATYTLNAVLALAKREPDDPRVPDALASAIAGTRFACGDDETGKLSQRAFALLKKNYANTEAAKQTKYWFDGKR